MTSSRRHSKPGRASGESKQQQQVRRQRIAERLELDDAELRQLASEPGADLLHIEARRLWSERQYFNSLDFVELSKLANKRCTHPLRNAAKRYLDARISAMLDRLSLSDLKKLIEEDDDLGLREEAQRTLITRSKELMEIFRDISLEYLQSLQSSQSDPVVWDFIAQVIAEKKRQIAENSQKKIEKQKAAAEARDRAARDRLMCFTIPQLRIFYSSEQTSKRRELIREVILEKESRRQDRRGGQLDGSQSSDPQAPHWWGDRL